MRALFGGSLIVLCISCVTAQPVVQQPPTAVQCKQICSFNGVSEAVVEVHTDASRVSCSCNKGVVGNE
jgi:hypothetical protein